jgi:heterodisulfide reductase subunit B
MMKIAYYPGCTLKTTAKNFEDSAIASAEVLEVEFVELERWNCCGTVHALAKDDVMHHLAPIRNLLRVEEMNTAGLVDNMKLVTLCAMCYNTLKRTNKVFNLDKDKKKKIHDIMDKEESLYHGTVDVVHYLELLKEMGWDKIKRSVEKPLEGLKIAPYYGCLLLRPRGVGIDNSDNPTIMEDFLEALGADVVDIAYKQKCCGSYNTVHMKKVVANLSYKILEQAKQAGANMIVTACPLCEYNLGPRQSEIEKYYHGFESIPVVYFTQLMALAFEQDKETTAFNDNKPDPRPLLIEKNLVEVE